MTQTVNYGETYIVSYRVKDKENTWSLPVEQEIQAIPQLFMDANLRTKIPGQSLTKFQTGNDLTFNGVWSSYQLAHYLTVQMYDGNTPVLTQKVITKQPSNYWGIDGNDIYWNDFDFRIPSNAGLTNKTYKLKISAVDSLNTAYYKFKDFFVTLVTNSPPTVTINRVYPTANPLGKNVVYEGDNASADFTPNDPDGDVLTVSYTLLNQTTGVTYPIANTSSSAPHTMRIKDILSNAVPGTYKLDVRVTDPSGLSASDSLTFTVNGLSITGSVKHTDAWENNRIKFNNAKTGTSNSPHDPLTFFSGEKLILQGTPTLIDANSLLTVTQITADLLTENISSVLTKNGSVINRYDGSMWNESMINWSTRTRIVRFKVTYSNGVIKTHDVTIKFDGDNDYWLLHRKF